MPGSTPGPCLDRPGLESVAPSEACRAPELRASLLTAAAHRRHAHWMRKDITPPLRGCREVLTAERAASGRSRRGPPAALPTGTGGELVCPTTDQDPSTGGV